MPILRLQGEFCIKWGKKEKEQTKRHDKYKRIWAHDARGESAAVMWFVFIAKSSVENTLKRELTCENDAQVPCPFRTDPSLDAHYHRDRPGAGDEHRSTAAKLIRKVNELFFDHHEPSGL